jgi:hypothetical protein
LIWDGTLIIAQLEAIGKFHRGGSRLVRRNSATLSARVLKHELSVAVLLRSGRVGMELIPARVLKRASYGTSRLFATGWNGVNSREDFERKADSDER